MSPVYIVLFLLPLSLAEKGTYRTHGVNVAFKRLRRSLTLAERGAAAAMALLKGAAKLEKQTKGFNYYVKKGTSRTAYRDFMAVVDPESIIKHKIIYRAPYEGRAGDRIIYYTPFDHHVKNKPTITIYDPKRVLTGNSGNLSDKIIYETN